MVTRDMILQAKEWLKIASDDLIASEMLYQGKMYAHAAFYYQQSVEKAFKAFLLALGEIDEARAKNEISHNPLRKYITIAKQYTDKLAGLPQSETKNKLKTDAEQFINKITLVSKTGTGDIYISESKIDENIDDIKQLLNGLGRAVRGQNKVKLDYEAAWMRMRATLVGMSLNVESSGISNMIKDFKSNISDIASLKSVQTVFFCFIVCFLSYFILSMITLPHVMDSRYPKGEHSPRKAYKKTLPFIRRIRTLFTIQDELLAAIEMMIIKIAALQSDTDKLISK